MMNDKELADKIVALGVGDSILGWPGREGVYMVLLDDANRWQDIEVFVRDWRVAGALMEKCATVEIDTIGNPWWVAAYALKLDAEGKQLPERYFKAEGELLPRAINEACVEALTQP